MLRIRDVYPESEFFNPGSRFKKIRIPDPNPHKIIEEFLTQKLFLSSRKYDSVWSSRILILIFYPSRIPDPGVKKAPDPGSATLGPGIRICIAFSNRIRSGLQRMTADMKQSFQHYPQQITSQSSSRKQPGFLVHYTELFIALLYGTR
jgi:hypothetical protein